MSVIFATREEVRRTFFEVRSHAVEVEQSTGYVLQDRALEGEREVGHVF